MIGKFLRAMHRKLLPSPVETAMHELLDSPIHPDNMERTIGEIEDFARIYRKTDNAMFIPEVARIVARAIRREKEMQNA